MRKKDQELLDGINEMVEQAPSVGLCAFPFKILRDGIQSLIDERDALDTQSGVCKEYSESAAEQIDVLMFIGRFSSTMDGRGESVDMVEHFTMGLCWWFAYILKTRFEHEYPCQIVVDYVSNHFACRINGSVYDITGRRADSGEWERWDDCADEALKKRITEDCIMF